MFLEVETEKVTQLILQNGKGYLNRGETGDCFPSNTLFPERSVFG